MPLGTHITHCCIVHGCKYGDEDCPVAIGTHKQDGLCEHCYFFGVYKHDEGGLYARNKQQQEEYVEAVWNEKHNPRTLTPLEEAVKQIAERHGRMVVLAILNEVEKLPFTRSHIDIQVPTVIDILNDLKAIE